MGGIDNTMTPPAEVLAALEFIKGIVDHAASACDGGERARAIEECERLVLSKPAGYSALWVAGDLAAILRALLPPAAAPTEGRDA